jgi:hypothetical protein
VSDDLLGVTDDLVLVPEVEARGALAGRRIRLYVLAPFGSWIGCGKLRVLRLALKQNQGDTEVELIVGYEAYTS